MSISEVGQTREARASVRQVLLSLVIMLVAVIAHGQEHGAKGFCETNSCNLPPDDEVHFDPYRNGHLCENYDPKQNDFSKEYLALRTRHQTQNIVNTLSGFDFSPVWLSVDVHQNGIIGLDYKRIRIFISKAVRDRSDNLLYRVEGKSNVGGNICDFKGYIRIMRAYNLTNEGNTEGKPTANLFAEYKFDEDIRQKNSGSFRGIMECFYTLEKETMTASLDEGMFEADGYFNRSYVGTWTSYNTKMAKKCIWGDYRLPFTFDFDCGDGEMRVCQKYMNNGWVTYNNGEEYLIVGEKAELKDKWWLRRTN
ncbi:hypothetical protein WBG78_20345 [Chryseolinea sp. T2]|uniref:hypothetical protein n=1 Tax=Chryseolinea sp. T2 TaxID=3129255 RepID=UPI003076DD2C